MLDRHSSFTSNICVEPTDAVASGPDGLLGHFCSVRGRGERSHTLTIINGRSIPGLIGHSTARTRAFAVHTSVLHFCLCLCFIEWTNAQIIDLLSEKNFVIGVDSTPQRGLHQTPSPIHLSHPPLIHQL